WLMPSELGYLEAEGLEKTWRFLQESIVREVDILSSRLTITRVSRHPNQHTHIEDSLSISSAQTYLSFLCADLGPYTIDYASSGRYMAVGGRKGHLALIDMKILNLIKEFQVRETVRDVVFLHSELFFAAAQNKYPYIYNKDGTYFTALRLASSTSRNEHGAVLKLQFLRNHFLLASINKFGQLHYQDVTHGGMGWVTYSCGKVTMWRPTSAAPLIKMLCHHGPVSAMAFHPGGHLMATAGMKRKIKLWDLRKFEVLHTYPGHAKTLQFSQTDLLGIGSGSLVQVWKDTMGNQEYSRYMSHSIVKGYQVGKLHFQPYEDVLGLGHSMGISSILVPGSGEPNFDTWVANPFETSS
ncbi:hypothetical protein IFM89_015545, partial [Coptis chinensis]